MTWANDTFPRFPDPTISLWQIGYWRVVKGENTGPGSYRVETVIFDHLDDTLNQAEAQVVFDDYVTEKKATGEIPAIKGLNLFLLRVNQWEEISDNTGAIVP